jgi:hypothetical protein
MTAALTERRDKRQAARRRVLWGSRLANLDGSRYLRCFTRDISFTGARVSIENEHFIEDRAWFLDLRNRFAYEAKVVWKRPPELGLEFARGYRLDELPSDPVRRNVESEY